MASGLVLWLKQVPLTKPQISAEFLCPSTEANQGTAHEALFKLIHAHHYHSPLLLNPPREPVSTPGNKSGFKPHTCSMVLRMSWLSSCIHNVLQANRFDFMQLGKMKALSKTESIAEQLSWFHLPLDGEWSVLGEVPSLEVLWETCAGHWKESTTPWHFILDVIAVLAKPQFG